jgi:pyruvate dehydrogenase E1 component alpha subunit
MNADYSETSEDGWGPDADTVRDMLRTMLVISFCDAKARAEARSGALRAGFYPVRGLEAACAAIGSCLRPRDYLVSTYRNLGDAVAKGVPLRSIVAEAYGRTGGTSKGKGGPMHLADVKAGLMATTGIVGSGLPIAAGLGLANVLDGNGAVTAVTFGDGATSIGATHEAMNLASLWHLPVVFACQNNQWGEHTALRDYAAEPDIAARASAYAMPGVAVDGFSPVECFRAMRRAVERARAGGGPTLLEFRTYRLTPHSAVADASYVPQDELARALERDPTPTFRQSLLDAGLLSAAEIAELEASARAEVADAFAFALASPAPGDEELYRDVFADEHLVAGR